MEDQNQKQDWMTTHWRPMMAVQYMVVCLFDFILGPILWSVIQMLGDGKLEMQWMPLTLQGAGFYHIAMGAVLGIAALTRGQEKIARISTDQRMSDQYHSPRYYQPGTPDQRNPAHSRYPQDYSDPADWRDVGRTRSDPTEHQADMFSDLSQRNRNFQDPR